MDDVIIGLGLWPQWRLNRRKRKRTTRSTDDEEEDEGTGQTCKKRTKRTWRTRKERGREGGRARVAFNKAQSRLLACYSHRRRSGRAEGKPASALETHWALFRAPSIAC